jgi:hypothetical protein
MALCCFRYHTSPGLRLLSDPLFQMRGLLRTPVTSKSINCIDDTLKAYTICMKPIKRALDTTEFRLFSFTEICNDLLNLLWWLGCRKINLFDWMQVFRKCRRTRWHSGATAWLLVYHLLTTNNGHIYIYTYFASCSSDVPPSAIYRLSILNAKVPI